MVQSPDSTTNRFHRHLAKLHFTPFFYVKGSLGARWKLSERKGRRKAVGTTCCGVLCHEPTAANTDGADGRLWPGGKKTRVAGHPWRLTFERWRKGRLDPATSPDIQPHTMTHQTYNSTHNKDTHMQPYTTNIKVYGTIDRHTYRATHNKHRHIRHRQLHPYYTERYKYATTHIIYTNTHKRYNITIHNKHIDTLHKTQTQDNHTHRHIPDAEQDMIPLNGPPPYFCF